MFVCAECGAAQPAAGRCPTDGTPLAPIGEDLLLGTTIGVYRVARLLGIGGMGRVYKGVHPAIGSRVAIKILSRECSDRKDLVERFFAEAKAANLIRHEGIVNVLDLATLPDGRPYIIMEYLDGAPLASIIEAGLAQRVPLPLGGLARLIAEVLDALGAAHAKGIIHRDLKPDNIYVAPSGRPKILDFGIAKLSDVGNTATRTGSLMGTPHYMSPEQAAGRTADHRADLYAIGVILFECATGRKPFVAEALFDLLRLQVEAPPPPPRSLRPDMPPELEQVILTALAKPADHRFASAMAMSQALQQASAPLPPDQWQPLLPPSARPNDQFRGASWAPTPPASWSGGSRPPPQPQPPSLGHMSTMPAGQLPHPDPQPVRPPTAMALSPQRSKTGWIILASAALIGGGITAAAVIANGHNSGPVAAGPGSSATVEAPAHPAGSSDPWAASTAPVAPVAPAPPAAPVAPEPPPVAPDDKGDKDDEDKDDDDKADPAAGDPLDQAFKQLDETISRLPPDQQKRLAAYKGLSKLPPAERMRRLQALARQGIPGIDLGIPLPGMPGGPPPPPPPPGSDGPAGAWITNHSLAPPPGFDPKHLDVSSFIPWAMAEARKAIPDAQLIRIDTNGVGPDGKANLALASLASDHGSIDVRFISPSHSKRDPNLPLGAARHDFKCMFRVMATPDGVEMMPIDFFDCAKERPVPPPRCSFSAVWHKAIARKAPSANAVGDVDYRSNGARPVWYFAIGSGADKLFSDTFNDDC